MDIEQLVQTAQHWVLVSGFKILLIGAATIFVNRLINTAFKKFVDAKQGVNPEQNKNFHTICSILRSCAKFAVFIVAGMLVLEQLGINIGPILAAAGVLGVAVGFGSQRLVEDIISGFIILINNQIRVGDVVDIDGKSGVVEKITLNLVVLRDEAGNVYYVRNGKIGVITNKTKDFSYYVAEIKVSQKESFEKIVEVVKQIENDLKSDDGVSKWILSTIEILGLEKFENSTQCIKIRLKTAPAKQWLVGNEFNLRLKRKFDELELEIK